MFEWQRIFEKNKKERRKSFRKIFLAGVIGVAITLIAFAFVAAGIRRIVCNVWPTHCYEQQQNVIELIERPDGGPLSE